MTIRFIEHISNTGRIYTMQRKRWWGWRNERENYIDDPRIPTFPKLFIGNTKEEVLRKVFAEKYKTTPELNYITEYPTILKY